MLIFLTAIVGVFFVRQQGLSTFQKLASQLQNLEAPVQTMFEGLVILISGILLITPGFFSDSLGFLGLIPVTRVIFIKLVASYILSRYGVKQNHEDNTLEGDFVELDDEDKIKHPILKYFFLPDHLNKILLAFYNLAI